MSSRQEEKERRREERLAKERAAAASAQRRRLVQTVGGVVVAIALVAGGIIALTGGGGGTAGDPSSEPSGPTVAIPPQREADLTKAVAAAGCAVREFPSEGQDHVDRDLNTEDYKTNPPTSGPHDPVPAADGIYPSANPPALRNWVHTLEHGRIQLQYKPGTPQRRISQLETLFNEPVKGGPPGYHMVLFQNNTDMTYQVAAVAWTRYVVCNRFTDKTFDALRAFRDQYVDQAPEQVP